MSRIFNIPLAISIFCSFPCDASVKVAIYTGTTELGDITGEFGTLTADNPFELKFYYDPSVGIKYGSVGSYEAVYGGYDAYGVPSPVYYTSLMINGVKHEYMPDRSFVYIGGIQSIFIDQIHNEGPNYLSNTIKMDFLGGGAFDAVVLDENVPKIFINTFGQFNLYTQDIASGSTVALAYGNLHGLTFEISSLDTGAGSVPELSSWLMFITGFAFLGGICRRKNAVNCLGLLHAN